MIERAPIPAMSLAVVGVQYLNVDGSNRRFEIELLAPGDPVDLVPEPTNKKDPRAIAVFGRDAGQLGYITAERAPRIGALIKEGAEIRAVFQVQTPFGCWIRATFDGSEPVVDMNAVAVKPMAAVGDGADPDPAFEPDPVWDD